MTIKRVNYQNHSDQYLIDSFKESGNEHALAALYARYRVSLGNYLHRRINDSESVTKVFNSIMTQLLLNSNTSKDKSSFAISLFALAYQQSRQFSPKQASVPVKQSQGAWDTRASIGITDLQSDLIELVYKLNFTPDEAAEIIGLSSPEFHHCLRSIVRHGRNTLNTLKRSRPLCQTTRVSHPPAAKQESLIFTAS